MIGLPGILAAGLFAVCLALCAAIGFEVVGHSQTQPIDTAIRMPAAPGVSVADSADRPRKADAWFKEIVARPLFSPDRRPIATDARSVRGLPRLTGIIVDGSRRIAIFAASAGGHATVATAGMRVGAYDVRDVADSGVTVVGPEGTTIIHPIFDAAPAAGATSPLAGRAPLARGATK